MDCRTDHHMRTKEVAGSNHSNNNLTGKPSKQYQDITYVHVHMCITKKTNKMNIYIYIYKWVDIDMRFDGQSDQ